MADAKLSALPLESVPALTDETYVVDAGLTSQRVTLDRFFGLLPTICDGRLTTESGVPVSSSDRTAQGTIYFTPYLGGSVALYDGTRWRMYAFAEVSLGLTATSGKNYDVFLYDNAGTLTLELSAAWTNNTTRADALARQNNVFVKSGTPTRRWIGTIRASGANVTADARGGTSSQVGGQRFVWNAYNQVPRDLRCIDTTDAWVYKTNTVRVADGATAPANCVEYVVGDASVTINAIYWSTVALSANSAVRARIGVGVDSSTVFSGLVQGGFNGSIPYTISALAGTFIGQPGLGYHFISELEAGADGTDCQFTGDDGGDGSQTGLTVWLPA